MGALIGALLGIALAVPSAHEVVEVDAPSVGVASFEGTRWTVLHAPDDHALHVTCPAPVSAPRRRLLDPTPGGVAVVELPLPEPVPVDARPDGRARRWTLPPPGLDRAWWAVDVPGCRVRAARLRTAPEALDRLEHRVADVDALRAALVTAGAFEEDPWAGFELDLAVAFDRFWPAYLALRPSGGFVPTIGQVRVPGARRTRVDVGPRDPARPWVAPAGTPVVVRGPAQVRLRARALGDVERVCLTVDDGDPSCLDSAPYVGVAVEQGALVPVDEVLDGRVVGRVVAWRVVLPPGRHRLVLDADALVDGSVVDVTALDRVARLPAELHVVPRDPSVPPRHLIAATPDGAPVRMLFAPAGPGRAEPHAVRWEPAADVTGTWWDEDGLVTVLLGPAPGGTCEARMPDGGVWVTATGPGVHTWIPPLGLPPVDAPPPVFSGCDAWIRTVGGTARGARTGVSAALLDPDVPVALHLPERPVEDGVLRVFLPEGVEATTIRLGTSAGTVPLRIIAPSGRPTLDAAGGRWSAPVDVPVRLPSDEVTVAADAAVAVRLAVRAPGPPPETSPRRPTAWATREAVRAASAVVATARDDAARASALLDRAGHLLALGRYAEAQIDVDLAAALGARADAVDVRVQRILDEGALTGLQGWRPVGRGWIPVAVAGDAASSLATLAAAGRHAEVARALGATPAAVRWWNAAAREQILTPTEGLVALATAARTVDPEHPQLGALRSWSAWDEVRAVHGTEGWRAPWPLDDGDEALVFDAPWPTAVALDPGLVLRLPPRRASVDLPVRCAARDAAAAAAPCRLRATDLRGTPVAEVTVSPWGAPATLALPPGDGPLFVELDAAGRVRAEAALPPSLAPAAEALREVRRTTEPEAVLDVLGPTVVRVEAAHPAGGVLRAGGEALALGAVPAATWLVLDEPGPHRVRLRAPVGTLLRVQTRVPAQRTAEPSAHASLLRPIPTASLPPFPAAPPVAAVTFPGRPRPWTLLASAFVGVGGEVDEDPEAVQIPPIRGGQRLTITSRPGPRPFWVSGGIAAWQAAGLLSVIEARIGAEGWWNGAPLDGWLSGDGTWRVGLDAAGTQALRGTLEAGLAWRPRRWADVRVALAGGGAARFGPWLPGDDVPALLWSAYRNAHPLWLEPRVELRAYPTPWMRARTWVELLTNPPGDAIVHDAVTAGLDLRFAAPSLYALGGVALQHRPLDVDRPFPYTTPLVYGTVRGTIWARHDVALDLRADADWIPRFRRVSLDLGVEVAWTGRRGLGDLRPSVTDARFGSAWREPGRFEVR